MRNTPQRTRSYASPTRDKIFIWSAVVAGCGIMALLGRYTALHHFGTDQFTGNVLFAVFFILSIGLYCGFQSDIESLFDRIGLFFRKKEQLAIFSTATGEEVAVAIPENPQTTMEYSAPAESKVAEEEPCCPEDDYPEDYSGGKIIEDSNDEDECVEEVLESDTLYNEWVSLQPKHIRKELELGIYRVSAYPESNDSIGCFTKTAKENRIKEENGNIRIEEWEEEVYISADGDVYYSDQLEAAIKALKSDKEQSELQMKLPSQHEQSDAAHKELKEEDMKLSMAQIEFLCAYITHMMHPYMEADELQKLHHNAKIWTVHAMPPFTPVNLRSNHLTKEDLKHLGYNLGKFLRLQGGVIARFVKKVFEKPFESIQIRTIEQKLRETKSNKERIHINTRDQMDKLFRHFHRYGNINLDILNRA